MLMQFCANYGLHFALSEFKIIKDKGLMVIPEHEDQGHYFVYISKDEQTSRLAKFYESVRNDERLGQMLGYPRCCIDFYLKNYNKAVEIGDEYSPFTLANSSSFPFETNNMLRFFDIALITHFPCKFDCDESLDMANARLECIRRYNPDIARYIEDALKGPVITNVDTGIHVLKGYSVKDDTVYFNKAWLTSPNTMHAVLERCNNIKIRGQNHIELRQDDHVVEECKGSHVGFMVFE